MFNYLVEASMNMSNECLCLCVLKNVLWVKLKNGRGGNFFLMMMVAELFFYGRGGRITGTFF